MICYVDNLSNERVATLDIWPIELLPKYFHLKNNFKTISGSSRYKKNANKEPGTICTNFKVRSISVIFMRAKSL